MEKSITETLLSSKVRMIRLEKDPYIQNREPQIIQTMEHNNPSDKVRVILARNQCLF